MLRWSGHLKLVLSGCRHVPALRHTRILLSNRCLARSVKRGGLTVLCLSKWSLSIRPPGRKQPPTCWGWGGGGGGVHCKWTTWEKPCIRATESGRDHLHLVSPRFDALSSAVRPPRGWWARARLSGRGPNSSEAIPCPLESTPPLPDAPPTEKCLHLQKMEMGAHEKMLQLILVVVLARL